MKRASDVSLAPELLRHGHARTSEFGGKVLQLGQPVLRRQDRLGVVDVNTRAEFQSRDRGRIDVHQTQRRVVGHQMTAASLAKLAVARLRFHEPGEKLCTFCDTDVLRLPQGEGVHGRRRPGPAGAAMAITHRLRSSVYFNLHGATETSAFVYC